MKWRKMKWPLIIVVADAPPTFALVAFGGFITFIGRKCGGKYITGQHKKRQRKQET